MSDRPLSARLGLAEGATVRTLDVPPPIDAMLGDRTRLEAGAADWFAVGVVDAAAIERIAPRVDEGYSEGARLWLLYPKRSGPVATDISRDHGWAPLLSRGFIPVAQVSVDGTWSALRFRRTSEVARVTRARPIGAGAPRQRAR
jgi:hypothetical protein